MQWAKNVREEIRTLWVKARIFLTRISVTLLEKGPFTQNLAKLINPLPKFYSFDLETSLIKLSGDYIIYIIRVNS